MSGRQPQEKSFGESILEKRKRQDAEIVADNNPQELIQDAKDQKLRFVQLKTEIDGKILGVNQTLEEVRQMIRDNLHGASNLDGVLTGESAATYFTCLELKHIELEQLLREDSARLDRGIEAAEKEASQLKKDLKLFMEQQRVGMEAFLRKRKRYEQVVPARLVVQQRIVVPEKSRFTLRKLPMWGVQVKAAKINFEWPSQQLLDQLPPDVCLKSIQLASTVLCSDSVSSVQCTLSNNECQPICRSGSLSDECGAKVIDFDKNRKVSKVQASSEGTTINRVTFLDKKNNKIDCYNPKKNRREGQTFQIGEKEELIGVYGVKGPHCFSTFGFIVKVSHD